MRRIDIVESTLSAVLVAAILGSFVSQGMTKDEQVNRIRSSSIRLGRCGYRLVASQGRTELSLQKRYLEGDKIDTINETRINLSIDGTITELEIAVWNNSSAIAIVESRARDLVQYTCVTFMRSDANNELLPQYAVGGIVHETNDDYKIMAINGAFRGDGLIVLLGKVREKDGFEVATEGLIFMNSCPQPASSKNTTVVKWQGEAAIPRIDIGQ